MPRGGNKQKLLNEREGKRQPAGIATSMGRKLYDNSVGKKHNVEFKRLHMVECLNYVSAPTQPANCCGSVQ